MPFELPALPWSSDALEPHISANTFSYHHGKHHAAYVSKLNELTKDVALGEKSLEDIIKATAGDPAKAGVFNSAAQNWNHTFFWNSMRPNGGGEADGNFADKIIENFGSFEKFKQEFTTKATTLFGSGWTWLVADGKKLEIVQTHDADTPLAGSKVPLITLDVWEHAYYLDYQNSRPGFIATFLDNLVNWDFASKNYDRIT
jgi:Fe-Mn family superoxide dismutase